MKKDPAFLFYSKDFYEGTRTMLPKERACLIDLMIYQHQHGAIPNDMERIIMYCSGIDEATLKATLEAKFKLTNEGWVNVKLDVVVQERKEYSNKQSGNGLVGQFFKKAKAIISAKELKQLKDYVYSEYGKDKLISELSKEQTTHEGMLKALLKHLAIGDAVVIKDKEDNNKGVVYFQEPKLNDAFTRWLKMCGEKGKPYAPTSIQALQMKLNTDKNALEKVNQSLEKGWVTLHAVDSNSIEKPKERFVPTPPKIYR